MSRRPAKSHCITFPLHSTGIATKVLVVHSPSPAAEEGVDDDFTGVSRDWVDVKERRFANCHSLILYQSKW